MASRKIVFFVLYGSMFLKCLGAQVGLTKVKKLKLLIGGQYLAAVHIRLTNMRPAPSGGPPLFPPVLCLTDISSYLKLHRKKRGRNKDLRSHLSGRAISDCVNHFSSKQGSEGLKKTFSRIVCRYEKRRNRD